MIQPRGAEIDVEILMQRIREGVAKHRLARFNASLNVGDSQLPVPPRSAAGVNTAVAQPRVVATPSAIRLQLPEPCRIDLQPAFQPSTTGQYHVNDLLVFHNEAFITAAYRALLRRAPDEPGFKYYLGRLRDGISKIQILGQIRYSPEGKSAGVVVSGLLVSYTLRKIYSWPILGRLAQTVAALWNFPNFERNQQKFENLIVQFIEKAGEHYQEYIDVLYRAAHDLEAGHSRLLAYQVETNAALRAAVDGLIQTVQSLAQTKTFLQAALDGVNKILQSLAQTKADQSSLNEIQSSLSKLRQLLQTLQDSKADKQRLEEASHLLTRAIETRAERNELTALTNHLVSLVQARLTKDDVKPVEQAVAALNEALTVIDRNKVDRAMVNEVRTQTKAALRAALDGMNKAIRSLSKSKADRTTVDAVRTEARASLKEVRNQAQDALQGAVATLKTQALDIKRNLLDQERRISLLVSNEQIEAMLKGEDHRLDAMYASFEDRFRGSRDDIRQRQTIYLPYIRKSTAGSTKAPVIDLGCGRGEWLELLRDEGLTARGVDLNRVLIKKCRKMKLDVTEQNAVAFLRGLKSNTVGAVTSFHLVEHLPFNAIITLFDESLRVLKPGGIAIFETPNPENLLVGACNFYCDPTHLNPLPPEPLKFALEARGFARAEIKRLHPFDYFKDAETIQPKIGKLFSGPQDYALIGHKA